MTRARLEAIRRNAFVGLQVFTEGAGGYLLFVDQNANRRYDPGEEFGATRFGQGNWARVRLDPEKSALGNMPLLFDPPGHPGQAHHRHARPHLRGRHPQGGHLPAGPGPPGVTPIWGMRTRGRAPKVV